MNTRPLRSAAVAIVLAAAAQWARGGGAPLDPAALDVLRNPPAELSPAVRDRIETGWRVIALPVLRTVLTSGTDEITAETWPLKVGGAPCLVLRAVGRNETYDANPQAYVRVQVICGGDPAKVSEHYDQWFEPFDMDGEYTRKSPFTGGDRAIESNVHGDRAPALLWQKGRWLIEVRRPEAVQAIAARVHEVAEKMKLYAFPEALPDLAAVPHVEPPPPPRVERRVPPRRLSDLPPSTERPTQPVIAQPRPAPGPVTIEGTVVAASGKSAQVAFQGNHVPRAGDKVDLFAIVPGVGEASVGTGTVTQARRQAVDIRVEEATGLVRKGHRARIHSAAAEPSASDEAAAYARSGEALLRQKTYAEAEVAFSEAVRLRPTVSLYRNELGNALYSLQKYREAEAQYRKGVELSPNDAVLHANLAGALLTLQRYDEAAGAARKARELGKKQHPVFDALADRARELGLSRLEQGENAEAEALLRQSVDWSPGSPNMHNDLGNVLYRMKRYKDAGECYRTASRMKPAEPVYHANLAGALFRQGQTDAARDEAKKAIQLGQQKHWVFDRLGLVP